MAAQLLATFEAIPAAGVKIVQVTLVKGSLTPAQIEAEFTSFFSTNFSGWDVRPTTDNEVNEMINWSAYFKRMFKQYLLTITDKDNGDGTITRTYTITQP